MIGKSDRQNEFMNLIAQDRPDMNHVIAMQVRRSVDVTMVLHVFAVSA
jgi:hypothetical protein